MALISMADWIDREGLDVEDDLAPATEPMPANDAGPLHLVPTHAMRWRRHHEPLHANLRPRLHRRALRLARLRRARAPFARS
jgi:hypothetical protein